MKALILSIVILYVGYIVYIEKTPEQVAMCEMYEYYKENTQNIYKKVEFADTMIEKYGEEGFIDIAAKSLRSIQTNNLTILLEECK